MKQLNRLLKLKQGKSSKPSQHPISPGKPTDTAGPSSHRAEPDADPGAKQSHPSSDREVNRSGLELLPSETGTTNVATGSGEHGTRLSSECFPVLPILSIGVGIHTAIRFPACIS